ncbi:uncharacterized protein LOC111379903 isoform X1 [Olea europaea subsp. europaea]|uniref:Uncharacterized protein LOC111379903 isoform X1 n=1 Tax=Olea europaea subsp. europaea TaxID=158383 RepID=A0A8S0RP88_OLEEU|nr:uncharacterized protein LOC111379903 isoform X1 [Olea europaea subsp. europaea]
MLKGSGMLAFEKFFALMEGRLPGKTFLEAVKYQMKREVVRKGGQLAAIGLESQAALIAAKQVLFWVIDVVIQMLGTDYARILRAVYAFARVYGLHASVH